MRKSLLLLAAFVPLALATPVIAASVGTAPPADPMAIDLDAIPVKPVAGPLAVKGVAGEDDDGPILGKGGEHRGGQIEAEDEGRNGAGEDLDD